jgi:cytochrome c553
MLAGLPPDFRATWNKVGSRILSEHDRFTADVYETDGGWAEDLSLRDASAGVYLLEKGEAGARFAIADPQGHAVADSRDDAGPSLAACARCHAGARDAVFPITDR